MSGSCFKPPPLAVVYDWRAGFLEQKIRDLLMNGNQSWVDTLYGTPWIQALHVGGKKPINIPARAFAMAVFNAFVPNVQGEATVDTLRQTVQGWDDSVPMKKQLLAVVTRADTSMDAIRNNIESWFNAAETAMTEMYRRKMWQINLFIALGVSLLLNVDTIAIGTSLWRDSALRQTVVSAAGKYVDKAVSATDPQDAQVNAQKAAEELSKLNLPIGWEIKITPAFSLVPNDWRLAQAAQAATTDAKSSSPQNELFVSILNGFGKVLGWFITAFAGAQGAPFWFDVLKKAIPQRGN